MKRLWIVLGLIAVVWWFRRGDDVAHPHHGSAASHGRVQAGVLADGFTYVANKRVIETDRDGKPEHTMPLKIEKNFRLVGTRAGTAVAFQDGKKLKLAILDSDGNTDDDSTWGKNVRAICDGAASNEYRFGIGWLESDGRVWFVHGPISRLQDVEPATASDAATAVTWCGIASAEQNVALLWRDGSRILMNFCTAKKCTSLVVKVPIETKDTLLGYGCVRDACLFATRDKNGNVTLSRVTEKGKAIRKALENATSTTQVSIVGAGQGAFAVSYIAKDNLATIHRVTTDLTFTNVWHFADEKDAAALAWADGKLLTAFSSGKAYVLEMKR